LLVTVTSRRARDRFRSGTARGKDSISRKVKSVTGHGKVSTRFKLEGAEANHRVNISLSQEADRNPHPRFRSETGRCTGRRSFRTRRTARATRHRAVPHAGCAGNAWRGISASARRGGVETLVMNTNANKTVCMDIVQLQTLVLATMDMAEKTALLQFAQLNV